MTRPCVLCALFGVVALVGCAPQVRQEARRALGGAPALGAPTIRLAAPGAEAESHARSASAIERIALFIPDRLLDTLDVVSFGLGGGYGAAVEVHATAFGHLPSLGAYQSLNVLNWYCGRNLAVVSNTESKACLGPFVFYRSSFYGTGTGWDNWRPGKGEKKYRKIGIASEGDAIYLEGYRDPWAFEVAAGPILLGPRVEAGIHPVEVVDLILGVVTLGLLDLSDDDLASPR